jgi:S1-C subfamily serine protease
MKEVLAMSSVSDWKVPASVQPKPQDYDYDLDGALTSVVGLRSVVPNDAFTAQTLGTERAGHGVIIGSNGLVLTIGYLITEASSVWLTLSDGRTVPGHPLAYDQETGFGLVQALARVELPALPLGNSGDLRVRQRVVLGGAGGRQRSVAARIFAKQEFAGYWEYVLDEALFTGPGHPNWGGTALLDARGQLVGIGSLQLQGTTEHGPTQHLNMVVPIDLLKPILDDLLTSGRPKRPPRPWLGIYAAEVDGKVLVAGAAERGPAHRADLRTGDVLLGVGGSEVSDLAGLFRRIWSLGPAGVSVPLTIERDGQSFDIEVPSADRNSFLKRPSLH